LREVIGLRQLPHFSTLHYAERRLFKGGVQTPADEYGAAGQSDRFATRE
jgi:hypothetical protein